MVHFWVCQWTQQGKPLLIVRFESLRRDYQKEIKRMLKFLGVEVQEEELRRRLKGGFDRYRRHHHDTFSHFTSRQTEVVRKHIRNVERALAGTNLSYLLPLQEYLQEEL